MTKLLAAAVLLVASSSSALTPAERVGAIAREIGVPLTISAPAVVVPAPRSQDAPRAAAVSSYVQAYGYLSGSGILYCNAPQNGSGWMNGSMNLSARMAVQGPDGASGTIPVSGYVFLSGTCQYGAGFVRGSTLISGYGPLYGRDGRRVGTARLSGTVFINQYASSQYLWINEYVSMTGSFDADAAN